jgi:hypothetical protein
LADVEREFLFGRVDLHAIDEKSPLAGYDAERLEEGDARLFLSIEARDMQSAPLP